MAKWRVWNKHPNGLTHTEKFKDQDIVIKAGEFVLMDYEDAVQFRGQYFPMKRNAQGAPDPSGFKIIHLEKHDDGADDKPSEEFVCMFDGRKFPTQKLLDQYLTENYADKTFVDEKIEEEIKATKRGRPAKEKTA